VSLTGFGLDESMGFDTRLNELRRHTRDDLEVQAVGPSEPEDVTDTPARAIAERGAVGCVGDSGAPLYATDTGAVLGVYSLLEGSSCTSGDGLNLFAHVPVYVSLMADAFDAAGSEPLPEEGAPPKTTGEGGASDGGAPDQAGSAGATTESQGGQAPTQAGATGTAGASGTAGAAVGGNGTAGGSGQLPAKKASLRSSGSGCALAPAPEETSKLGPVGVALLGVLLRRRLRVCRRAD
jgi:hypothetical protein